jgi:hypothetical protein
MDVAAWFRPPRQVVTTFVAVAALSAAALGGLAWQLLAQDRDLAVRRQQIELDARAGGAATMRRAGGRRLQDAPSSA